MLIEISEEGNSCVRKMGACNSQTETAYIRRIESCKCGLNDVPLDMRTTKIYLAATIWGEISTNVNLIPPDLLLDKRHTRSMMENLLERDPFVLRFFDYNKRNRQMCVSVRTV